MTLSDFIRRNAESIAQEWAAFARTCEPAAASMNIAALRDHILPLLQFVADDMDRPQTPFEQKEKAQGRQRIEGSADSEAQRHAALRVIDGFTVDQVVGEFRALRASILGLWLKDRTTLFETEIAQVGRFNEAIDQMLAESVARHGALESAARENSRKRDAFLATLSHELRNPLSAISNASHVVAAMSTTHPSMAPTAAIMVRQTRHLSRLLDDLLDLGRISNDRIALKIAAADIRECVQDAIDANRESLTRNRHTLKVRVPDEPVLGEIDCTRIVQVVSNLLNNANKYSPTESHIEVSLTREGNAAIISVTDNGPGIEANMLPHLFTPFYADRQRDPAAPTGLGIGLSLSRRLVELHGGTLIAASEGAGRGAEFRATIPLRHTRDQPTAE